MQLADGLDDFVEQFVHHIADVSFERLVFLARGLLPNTLIDSSILFIEAEDCLRDFSCMRSNRLGRSSFNCWDLAATRKKIFSATPATIFRATSSSRKP